MAQQTVALAPGESKTVSFEVTPPVAKSYSVSVNGLTGSFKATSHGVTRSWKVTEADTGVPIEGVRVAINGTIAYTDASGNVSFSNLIIGKTYIVEFTSPYFARQVFSLTPTVAEVEVVNVQLYPIPLPPVGLLGDLDDDGIVTEADLRILIKYLGGYSISQISPLSETEFLRRADVNQDGKIDAGDYTALERIIYT